MVTLGYLCGHQGFRPLGSFIKSYESYFRTLLGLKHPVPSYVTLREVLMRLPSDPLIGAFNAWAATYPTAGAWLSADGKALSSTFQHTDGSRQDFSAVVSLFSQQTGLVHRLATYRNGAQSELEVVRQLVEHLQAQGAILTLDALHTQKNP